MISSDIVAVDINAHAAHPHLESYAATSAARRDEGTAVTIGFVTPYLTSYCTLGYVT